MTEAQRKTPGHPFDVTKVGRIGVIRGSGRRDGHRYPNNFFVKWSRPAFSARQHRAGIGFSPAKCCRASGSYGDKPATGIGVNFTTFRSTRPQCPFQSYHRDGKCGPTAIWAERSPTIPTARGLWGQPPDFAEPPLASEGDAAHWDHRVDDDHWEHPAISFPEDTPAAAALAVRNTRVPMATRNALKARYVCTAPGDPAYGQGVPRRWAQVQPTGNRSRIGLPNCPVRVVAGRPHRRRHREVSTMHIA